MQLTKKVRVAILDCDRTVPRVQEAYGPYYSSRFIQVLDEAAQRSKSKTVLEFSVWNVMKFEYPRQEDIDAILVPGSVRSAYENIPWINTLTAFVRDTYDRFPHIRIFGTCFGHQAVGQAILGRIGAVATKDPKGYEVGVHTLTFNPEFAAHFNDILGREGGDPKQLSMQFVHGDHLDMSRVSLPKPWMNVGRTHHCTAQGLFHPGRVLTLQGHSEFNEYICYESVSYYFTPARGWSPEEREKALKATQKPDEGARMIDIVFAFLAGELDSQSQSSELSETDAASARARSRL